jgi:uncharacterized protein
VTPTARRILWFGTGIVATLASGATAIAWWQAPFLAANGLLHPMRHAVPEMLRQTFETVRFEGAGVTLTGWRAKHRGVRRGTIVYLHGVADNRGSAIPMMHRYAAKGFEVIAYDSRAHGESTGEVCTYGFYEKQDLRRVLDAVQEPVVLMGSSLGAAVALQEAADDPRVRAVVAAESFSDLRTIAVERAPKVLTEDMIRRAFDIAAREGKFEIDAVSPLEAAHRISVPVLLVHGAADEATRPEHSRRIYEALAGPKRLLIVDGAGHNQSLSAATWDVIDQWLDTVLSEADR